MSRYIQILNAVKHNLARISLTPSQASCRIRILERLEYPGLINLYGKHGVGKTTLGWFLEDENHFVYLEHPSRLQAINKETLTDNSTILFIDNASHQHHEFRVLLDQLSHHRIRKTVVCTNHRVDDYVQALNLDFIQADADLARDNLSRLGFPTPPLPDDSPFANLWEILQYNARRQYYAE